MRFRTRRLFVLALVAIVTACGSPRTDQEAKVDAAISAPERGRLSLYGPEFAGRETANGDRFDPQAMTMAHRTLPFGTRVRVTNLENQRSVEVVVNDRGPFIKGRIADLSPAAARRLGMVEDGVVDGMVEITAPAKAP